MKRLSPYFSLIGFPDDTGIRNVSGRPGAAEGPAAFRKIWQKLNGRLDLRNNCKQDFDIPVGSDLDLNHENAFQAVLQAPESTMVVVGGGHDYAWPWLRALSMRGQGNRASADKKTFGCLNIDAHFDLRRDEPFMTSGSPFYRLIENKELAPQFFTEFGIQDHCNKPELWKYAQSKKIRTVTWKELRNKNRIQKFKTELNALSKKCDAIALSFDLDSVASAHVPGVSSPQAAGFSADEIFQMMEIAGKNKKVISLGVFELSPPNDLHDISARFAAQAVWNFLVQRFQQPSKI